MWDSYSDVSEIPSGASTNTFDEIDDDTCMEARNEFQEHSVEACLGTEMHESDVAMLVQVETNAYDCYMSLRRNSRATRKMDKGRGKGGKRKMKFRVDTDIRV